MHHRVLIIGTIPFNPDTQSRAFNSYFKNWEPNNLRQIFSDSRKPVKGHCGSLYQLTDANILRRMLGKIKEPGVIYEYNELTEHSENQGFSSHNSLFFQWLYKIGSLKNSINRLLRKKLWKRKYWATEQLNKWLDDFQPDCVFLAFSDDFFINEIAIYVANRFNVPIMCCIGDDYYFNDKKSLSPFYYIYRKKYKALIDNVFTHKCSAIYIGEKIRDKYNNYFNIEGEVVYLTSEMPRRDFRIINVNVPYITYCGNIRLGRNYSLIDIGNALVALNSSYRLTVYSSEKNKRIIRTLTKCRGIDYRGAISYEDVKKVFSDSDIVVIVEGFRQKDINETRYSLSTKAADSIVSGCQIFSYGSEECGVIEYLKNAGCSAVCTSFGGLKDTLHKLITNSNFQSKLYCISNNVANTNHNLEKNNQISERLFQKLIEGSNAK